MAAKFSSVEDNRGLDISLMQMNDVSMPLIDFKSSSYNGGFTNFVFFFKEGEGEPVPVCDAFWMAHLTDAEESIGERQIPPSIKDGSVAEFRVTRFSDVPLG